MIAPCTGRDARRITLTPTLILRRTKINGSAGAFGNRFQIVQNWIFQ
jgi:hypothetical protein